MKEFRAVLATLVLFGAVFGFSASAANVVTNPSFAGNTAGWNTSSTTYDAANDATGVPGSGSAMNTFVAAGPSTLLAIDQCIVAGPGNYTLGGKVFIPNGQAVGGSGFVTVSYFSGPNCTTGFISFASLSTSTTGSFQTLSGPITAPAGTTHIWITGQNSANGAGTHVVHFDDFVLDNGLGGAVAQSIPTVGPLAMLALAAALGVIGVFVLRR